MEALKAIGILLLLIVILGALLMLFLRSWARKHPEFIDQEEIIEDGMYPESPEAAANPSPLLLAKK